MAILYALLGVVLAFGFGVWWTYFRVPTYLKGFPVVPGARVPREERRRIIKELAKTHEFGRIWFLKWHLVILKPELAKIVETNSTLYEKRQSVMPSWSFFSQFMGASNVVNVQTEEWKKHRAVINPAFDFTYIRSFSTIFSSVADKMINAIKAQHDENSPVRIHEWLQRYTLDCLGLTSFGHDFNSINDPDNKYVQTYHRIFDVTPKGKGVFYPPRFLIPFGLFDLLPLQMNKQMKQDIEVWKELLDKMVNLGKTAPGSDVAALLIKANAPDAAAHLTLDEIKGNLSVFFVAGHETSATSLAATLWYLARYPEIQEKVYQEVVRVTGKTEEPTFEEQKEYDYLTNVIYESNRLAPPVKQLPARVVMEDTQLGNLKLKKDDLVIVNIEGLQLLDTEFPNPDVFDPDRFANVKHHPFSWQPFGAGPRACLGRNFSVLEQRIALARFLQAFKVELPKGAPDKIEIQEASLLMQVDSEVLLRPRE